MLKKKERTVIDAGQARAVATRETETLRLVLDVLLDLLLLDTKRRVRQAVVECRTLVAVIFPKRVAADNV